VHHYEELVEMIETNILFAIFEAQNKKISISLVKKEANVDMIRCMVTVPSKNCIRQLGPTSLPCS
jgi:hypothetical protein